MSAAQQYTHPDITASKLIKDLTADATYQKLTGTPTTPIMIWGQPGIGKSNIIRQVGINTNRPVIDIRLLLKDPADIGGLPYFDPENNEMRYARPAEFPRQGDVLENAIILMDELSSAPQTVQAAALGLVLERQVNDYVLPDNVMMVAAGNRSTDGTVHNSMPQPLRNRFHHVNLTLNSEDWLEWAMKTNISVAVQSFIKSSPENLNQFDPKQKAVYAYATPRSWEFVSKEIYKHDMLKKQGMELSDTDLHRRIASLVGENIRSMFKAHFDEVTKLPNPYKVVSGEVKEAKIEKTSMKYACSLNIAYALRETINTKLTEAKEGGKPFEECDKEYNRLVNNALTFLYKNIEEKDILVATFWMITDKEYGIDVSEVDIIDDILDDPDFSKFFSAI